ncbi:hypothetical protein E1J61_16090 [Cupriavidus sp. L7L]|nr:hypothetical protein E1J61_16090 [Cupriavidus sp. L7L]
MATCYALNTKFLTGPSKRQQMRWSISGAHYLLQARVELLDGQLEESVAVDPTEHVDGTSSNSFHSHEPRSSTHSTGIDLQK